MEDPSPSASVIRSIESKIVSPVSFKNDTGRNVNIVWLGYHGEHVSYAVLNSQTPPLAMNTYVTHPWIAIDEESKRRMWLNSKDVFYPPTPTYIRIRFGADRIAVRARPTQVMITVPVYNAQKLQDICCQVISRTKKYEDVDKLPLPKCLKVQIKRQNFPKIT